MNKLYVIGPGVLLSAFLVFERDFEKKRAKEEDLQVVVATAKKQADDLARAKREEAAALDTRKRTEEREQQDRERAEKKQHDYEAMIAKLREQADQQVAEAEKLTAELTSLTSQLTERRAKKEASEREAFELARQVELQRVDRRSAEIETQRATTIVAVRLSENRWAPAPTAATPNK